MTFINPDINNLVGHLKEIDPDKKPIWGSMNAIRMVEHIADTIRLAKGDHPFSLSIPEDKVDKAQGFLKSEHPLPKNFKVEFATDDMKQRSTTMDEAIEDLKQAWNEFNEFFKNSPDKKTLHPSFGKMNYDQWMRLHAKHTTHHLQQFGLDV